MLQLPVFIVFCERISRRSAYYLKFPYNEQLVNIIKNLPEDNRKWNQSNNAWELKSSALLSVMKNFRGSKKIHFDFGNKKNREDFAKQIKKIEIAEKEKLEAIALLNENKKKWIAYKDELEKDWEKYSGLVHKNLKEGTKLYKHQIVGIMFTNEVRNLLISNEMGLGKTIQSIGYVELNEFKKVVVICPNSLKFNYMQEIYKFSNSTGYIVGWKKNKQSIEDSKYIILNYEFFNASNAGKTYPKWDKLNIKDIDCLICDESHRLKTSKSNTYKNFKKIFTKTIFRNENVSKVFLAGTPMPNASWEIWNLMNQISPLDFSNKNKFLTYYCGMEYDYANGWGWVKNDAEAKLEELYYKISSYCYRKRKIDVLDLPEKIYQNVIFEMTDAENSTYEKIESGVANEFLEKSSTNPLTILIRLQQYTSSLKINGIVDFIKNILESGEKVVVIDKFKDSLYKLKEIFGDIAGLHVGEISVEERSNIVNQFQDPNSNIRIFLGSVSTSNYGITLTAASKLINLTPLFVPGEFQQLSDRIHRIGTKFTVNIYSPIMKNTVDEYIMSVYENKMKEIVKVMDNEDFESNTNQSVLSEVVKKIKEKHKIQ